jgi:carboxyl-terminal processing protease
MISKRRLIPLSAMVLTVAVGLSLMIGPSDPSLAKSQETYENLKIFSEVLSLVETNYVEEIDSQKLVYGAIRGMMRELDPHSAFMTADMFKEMQVDTKGEFGGLGITIGMKNDILTVIAPIEDTPAWRAGIKAGDQIVKVNGDATREMTVEEAVKKMRGTPGTSVTITIMREGFEEPKDYTIVRDIIKLKSVKSRIIDERIGHIRLTAFQEHTSRDLEAAMEKIKATKGLSGLVLDLRNNPGGLLDQAVKVGGFFLPANQVVVSTKGRKTSQNMEFKSSGGDRLPGVPMVVLVNHGSASASEIVSGALQDWGRALVMGTKTFGKASVQTVVPLEDGSGVRLTTAKYYTPKGRSIQNTGITPDVEVQQAKVTLVSAPKGAHPKEEDLKNHLTNDQKPEKEKSTPAEEEDSKGEAVSEEEKSKDDYQLERAVDVLKSWAVFQKLSATQAPAATP